MPARKLLSALRVLFLISVLTPVVFGQATGQAGEGQLIETKVSAVDEWKKMKTVMRAGKQKCRCTWWKKTKLIC